LSQKTAYILSLKYAPGLQKGFMLLGENLRKRHINVIYLLSKEYSDPGSVCENVEYITSSYNYKTMLLDSFSIRNMEHMAHIFSETPPDLICFYNPHLLNTQIVQFVKDRFPQSTTALYLHEPFVKNKLLYGLVKASFISVAEYFQKSMFEYLDKIILASEYANNVFRNTFPRYAERTVIAPFLVPDYCEVKNTRRRFFSSVGYINPSTGMDTFVELINHVAKNRPDYKFALITSSRNIKKYLFKLARNAINYLYVINKDSISDAEINTVIRESYAVFRLNKVMAQSGVIPISYMNWTPVIVRDIPGLTQHVSHKNNGYVIPYNSDPEAVMEAMGHIIENFDFLSENARKSYLETWSENNWDRYYGWLIDSLKERD